MGREGRAVPRRELYIQGRGVVPVIKALSNEARLEILDHIGDDEVSVGMLTDRMGLSKTAVLGHLNILEEAGFVRTRTVAGTVGNQKVCKRLYDRLVFDFASIPSEDDGGYYETSVQPGNFFDHEVYPPCGLATPFHVVGKWDDPSVFLSPGRVEASILWCAFGMVEYRIPLNIPFEDVGITRLEIILELSAQDDISQNPMLVLPEDIGPGRITDGVSDVTFEVGGHEIGSCLLREYARFGGGRHTPAWWKGSSYGKLVRIAIDREGTTIDGERASGVTLGDVLPRELLLRNNRLKRALHTADYVPLRVGIRRDAAHISGFTLFGHGFGEHTCDIVVRFYS